MGKLELHTGEVHIWKLRWRELETFWEWHKPLLEKEEYQKVKHYHFYEDQMRYLTGKIAVRMLLKEYSGVDKIVLRKGKYGKLYWKAPPGQNETDIERLKDINVTTCVESIINQIGETDEKLTLVFHSMAGIFIYDTYKKIGKEQIESIYCVACCIPAAGETMSDILKGPLHSFASFCAGKIQVVKRFPKILALAIFGNGMNKKQREKLYSSLCGESTNLLFERINECKLETSIKWILPTKDRALNPKQQRVYMNNIGNIKSIIKLTAPHDVMISHPEEVAKILLEN